MQPEIDLGPVTLQTFGLMLGLGFVVAGVFTHKYLIELGPSIVPLLVTHLQDSRPAIRGNVALVLGALGGDEALTALEPLAQDRDRDGARTAGRAIERIKIGKTQ